MLNQKNDSPTEEIGEKRIVILNLFLNKKNRYEQHIDKRSVVGVNCIIDCDLPGGK